MSARDERRERRVDGIAGHYSETRICSFVSSLCMRRGVCASFYRLKSRLRITVQMIFFRVRTRALASRPGPRPCIAPNRTPSSSSRTPSAHASTCRQRLPALPICVHLTSSSSSLVGFPCSKPLSLFRGPMRCPRACCASHNTPRDGLKRNLKPVPGPAPPPPPPPPPPSTWRCEMTRSPE